MCIFVFVCGGGGGSTVHISVCAAPLKGKEIMNKNVKLSDCKLKGRCEGTLSVQLWRARMSWATHTLHLRLLTSDCGSSQKRQSRKRKRKKKNDT